MALHHLGIDAEVLAGNGSLGRVVLLPGSVGRAERIGERLLDHRVHPNPRRLDVHVGVHVQGERRVDVAAVPTGMGCPSVDIVVGELLQAGARRLVRVGTAGAVHPTVQPGHLVIASGAVRDEGASDAYVDPRYPAMADPLWVAALADAAAELGLQDEAHIGVVHTKDAYFGREFGVGPDGARNEAYLARLGAAGVLASEMEAAHLFVLGSVLGAGPSSVAVHRDGRRSGPPGRGILTRHHRVPVIAAPLLGREGLLAAADAVLERPGLLTLTGPGGSGKTRLAAHLASEARARGVTAWWADLQSARTMADFEREVAWAVGGAQAASDPGARLAEEDGAWLVLDNLEQLPPEVGPRIEGWLSVAPRARIVATSRVALGRQAEHVLLVPPLPIPDEDDAFAGPAWMLLSHHAPRGSLAAAEPADVVRLLRAVDGLPLAIQLAAGRLEVMSLPMLADRLDRLLDVLADPRRRGNRHGSLRGVARWSWELLSRVERAALIQLGAFRGSFSLEAAEAVLDLGDEEVLDAVHRLLRRHLVVRDGDWLRLLEVVRAFAVERRQDADGDPALFERHARWLLGAMDPELPDVVDEDWFSSGLHCLPEAYAVLGRAERGALDARLAHAVWRRALIIVRHRRAIRELGDVAERLLALPGADAGQRARQHYARSLHRRVSGDTAGARADLDRAEQLAREAGDRKALCDVHLGRAMLFYDVGDHAGAVPHFALAEEIAVGIGAWRAVVHCKLCRSVYVTKELQGPDGPDREEVRRLLDEAVAMAEGRDVRVWVNAQVFAAGGLSNLGQTREAYEAFLRARPTARSINALLDLAAIEGGLGDTAEILGDLVAAAAHLHAAWRAHEQLGHPRSAAYQRGFYGRTLVRLGSDAEGIHHMREALAALERLGGKRYHREFIQGSLDLATADDPATWEAAAPDDALRLLRQAHRAVAEGHPVEALRALLAELDAIPLRKKVDLLRADLVDRLRVSVETWQIAADGSWFRPPSGERCVPGTNQANAGILAHLAARRSASPGDPSAADELFEAGWPGERAVAGARQNRVRVALSGLRDAGLRALLQRAGRRGWYLDPEVPVTIVAGDEARKPE